MEDGFAKAQELYRNKNKLLASKIKRLGYSFTTSIGNWKDKTEKDTYQRERFLLYLVKRKILKNLSKIFTN